MAWSTRYGDLLEDPEVEAVVDPSPTRLHARMVEAASAGKHVFREKPIPRELGRFFAAMDAVVRSPRSRGWAAPETYTRGGAHG